MVRSRPWASRSHGNREGRRPERTVYAITDAGRAEAKDWLRELVSEPAPEPLRFEAALSVLGVLPPDEVIPLLEQRLHALDRDSAARRAGLEEARRQVARVFLIEGEYSLAMREAEAAWMRSLLPVAVRRAAVAAVRCRTVRRRPEPPRAGHAGPVARPGRTPCQWPGSPSAG